MRRGCKEDGGSGEAYFGDRIIPLDLSGPAQRQVLEESCAVPQVLYSKAMLLQ